MEICLIATADRDGWRSLWNVYCDDQGVDMSERGTETIWRRIKESDNPTNALIAVGATGVAFGFANFIIHPYLGAIVYSVFSLISMSIILTGAKESPKP
ncbi:hypothetical protein NKH96_30020 [Mesorhizobium sp. M0843]